MKYDWEGITDGDLKALRDAAGAMTSGYGVFVSLDTECNRRAEAKAPEPGSSARMWDLRTKLAEARRERDDVIASRDFYKAAMSTRADALQHVRTKLEKLLKELEA